MQNRIFDLAESPARLRVVDGLLEISAAERQPLRVRFAEIAVLIAAHPQITFTQPVLSGLSGAGAVLLTCDARRLPVGMTLPLDGHSTQGERFSMQAAAPRPLCKRLWQQVVRAKIAGQAAVLREVCGDDAGLAALARLVRSGDPENVEARAARRYWPLLFDDDGFRRDRDRADQNRLLNYGYAVLRATIARAICAAGLHPCLGLHHHNRYNAFCLADDLMEPFRPVVDLAVARHVEGGGDTELCQETRRMLLAALTGRCLLAGEQRTLFDAAARAASSLAEAFAGGPRRLDLPEELVCAAP